MPEFDITKIATYLGVNMGKFFQFSILRVLEPGTTNDRVNAQEGFAKVKLGNGAFGLYLN